MRTSSHARVVLLGMLACALAAATASAQDALYLRAGSLLSPVAPEAGSATITLSARIPAGESALLATFTTAPLEQDVTVGDVRGVLYLGTGRPGMDGCAFVTASLARLAGVAQTVVAEGSLVTSIKPRKRVTDPILVPMALGEQTLAAAGDRLALQVRVRNDCGGERNVFVLYDSPGRPSRLELTLPGVTTTTVTTTSTTTTLPTTCLDTAAGLALVRCRLETMDGIVRGASPASLGGPRFVKRFSRKIDRALTFIRAAELVEATPKRLRKARRQLLRFETQLARGRAAGRVAPEVGDPLGSLAQAGVADLNALLGS